MSSTLSWGIVVCPFASSAALVIRLPDRPLALSPYSLWSLAAQTMANRSPPIPVIGGSTTLSTAAAVTAASTALPPRSSTARPAAVASGWPVAIMPCGAYTVGRGGATGVKFGARGEAESADEPRAQVGEDVAVEVVRHDHLKPLGLAHQLQRQRVHVAVLGLDAGERGGPPLERFLPHLVSGDGV